MKRLIVRLEKELDALWALHPIAKLITAGYIKGDYHGVKWWLEDEPET